MGDGLGASGARAEISRSDRARAYQDDCWTRFALDSRAMGQVNTELSCRCLTPDPVSSQRGDWTGKRIDNLAESNKIAVARCHMRRAARPGLEARRYGSDQAH
jgi:hypothetical protein